LTPVCTTELAEFARRADDFAALGVSVDSIHSHLAWLQNMKEKLGVEVPYPMIADIDAKVAPKYGMIHPEASATATVRAVFVSDPKRTIHALLYYPLNAGRNVDQILRLVEALQTVDRHGCSTPDNWQPGGKVVVPPPKVVAEVDERLSHKDKHYDVKDFCLSLKDLPKP
jgi:peroxiredoxin 2/4